ncbi:uncharacterized protein RHOBADRAFT_54249 [Rhodotorula graminis WP1]|uniref:F-box domain-containing protein n=1 Tax=Rhodotorula graminis (strain WP1) TaxID=578459 RepID=A0A194S118_RHOGW|nr:uncharacterized protein RHOBADRAFT_54249 [Rhodotorula graminis WP1]KPV74423.1 hypothetical protein RHOBADRAFT_54249 [Rhodotorula graminis WP1]
MNSSPPSSAPAKRRKKQPKSCRLVRLPTSVVRLIFSHLEDLPLDQICICRALHPFLLDRLYSLVGLSTVRKIRSFASALAHHPERARLVITLRLYEKAFTSGKDTVIDLQCGDKGAGQLHDFATAPSCEDVIGIGLLKDIICRLPVVHLLVIWGDQLASHLFSPDTVAQPNFPRLRHLFIVCEVNPHNASAPDLWRHLGSLSSLDLLIVHHLNSSAAGDVLNLDTATHVAPRSILVKHLIVKKALSLGPGFRRILQSLAVGLREVEIDGWVVYPSLLDDLALLPPTVERLEISLGQAGCAPPDTAADVAFRKGMSIMDRARRDDLGLSTRPLSTSLASLPNLVTVILQGDIVSSATFEYLADLEHLKWLRLGTHTRFSTDDVVDFVWAAPAL